MTEAEWAQAELCCDRMREEREFNPQDEIRRD